MVVCGRCANQLARDLADVPGLALALEASHHRGQRFSAYRLPPLERPVEEESPLPFNPAASETMRILLDTLTRWADVIARQRGQFRPLNTAPALATWLYHQVPWLRSAQVGPEAVDKLRGVIKRARGVVDRPPDLQYAGPCTGSIVEPVLVDGVQVGEQLRVCRADLYAADGQDPVACRVCGAHYPLEERRQWLLGQAEDMLLPATELARAIDGLGVAVTPTVIRQWKARRLLVERGLDRAGHPLYRLGDVAYLAGRAARRKRPTTGQPAARS